MADAYTPPLAYRFLTRVYDPVVRLGCRDATVKAALLAQMSLAAGMRVLDLGCGTGTLAVRIAQTQPGVTVVGVDLDEAALALAAAKADRAGVAVDFRRADMTATVLPGGSVDRVASSLAFHHLTADQKRAAFRETVRVLRPGGELHLADWGPARTPLMRAAFGLIQLLDGFATTRDHARGRLPGFAAEAGLAGWRDTARFDTLFGTLVLSAARKADV